VGGDFNHHVLVHRLADLNADWVLSYQDLPDGLGDALDDAGVDYWVARKDTHNYIRNFRPDAKEATERLVLNFDPEQADLLTNPDQKGLADFDGGQ